MFMYQYAFGNIHLKNKISISFRREKPGRGKFRREKARAGKIPAGKNPSAVVRILQVTQGKSNATALTHTLLQDLRLPSKPI